MSNTETVEVLFNAIITAIDEVSEGRTVTTGDAMTALFSVFVASAQASPEYDPQRLVTEVDERIREAVALQ